MDKQPSSAINQWTKGSNNDSKSTQKSDLNSKTPSNYNSFEFLDMSSCDETQKLKLKNTLSSPSSFSTQRDRYRSSFATRNSSIKPTPQQYSTIQYHANSKNQKTNYQFYPTKHPNSIDFELIRHVPSRSFSSDANNFSSKNTSNFNTNISTLSNTTNINSKRLDDTRHYSNSQDKWHSNMKRPPYVGLKESTHLNQKDTSSRANYHQQPKEAPRDSNKIFLGGNNRNMSPPVTSSTTPTTISMSNQNNQAHFNTQQVQYGSSTPQMHSQMYPSGAVPLISHYPMHPGYMTTVPPGQPMIQSNYSHHGDRNDQRDIHNEHQSNQPSHRGSGGGRRGRSRGGNNNMSRRDYNMRQNNLSQQSSDVSNEYGQPLMEQAPPYQPIYIHHYPYYGGPNGGAPHIAALPSATNSANAQNLTGQPLFAIQQPMLYQYGAPYPIMYNMMPTQGHPLGHQQPDMIENEHNQNQETGGAASNAVIHPMAWPHPAAYQEPPQLYQHPSHLNQGEDLEFQIQQPDDYHLQMLNHPTNYHLIAVDPRGGNMANQIVQSSQDMRQDEFTEPHSIEKERMYQTEVPEDPIEDEKIIEKTRDLMIQTTPQEISSTEIRVTHSESDNNTNVPNQEAGATVTESVKFVDNKMLVINRDKPPAWGAPAVPNLVAPASVKKQTASVSVSAIPNKDALHLQKPTESASLTSEGEPPTTTNAADHNPLPAESMKRSTSNKTSFSSIITAKQPLTSPSFADGKKTENKHSEMQPLQKHQQMALSERAKQQIVTTITGVGAVSTQEPAKKPETPMTQVAPPPPVEELTLEKVTTVKQSVIPTQTAPVQATSGKTWACLFGSAESASVSKMSPVSKLSPKLAPTTPNQVIETQRTPTAKTLEQPTPIQSSPKVPGAMSMSYSAVSAQSVSTIPLQLPAGGASISKKLPQNKINIPSNTNENLQKPAPVDQHALRLGDFFSKYKIESNSISLVPRGLLNKSNYCYINAILQALVACPPFYHLMKSIPHMPLTYRDHTKTPVTDAMVELVSNYSQLPYRKYAPRDKNKKDEVPEIARDTAFEPIVILKMLQALRTDMFPVEGRQEDAEEFLSFILNRMNDEMIELKKLVEKPKAVPKPEATTEEVNGNTDLPLDDEEEWQVISGSRNKSTITRTTDFGRSPISDIFGGKLRLKVHREGDHSSENIEPFFTLKLSIEKASSVKEALEILGGRDQLEGVTCSRTNQEVAAWQQATLEQLPVVLILHLKCFDFKKDGCTKILKTVEFPVELKLDQKIMASKNKHQPKQKQYKLFAVVYHDGKEASKGHYVTDVFHVGYSNWIRYDDSTVKAVPEGNVLHPKSPRVPYLLYYRRITTERNNTTK